MTERDADVSLRKDSPPRGASSSRVAASTRGVRPASRVANLTESVIRDITRVPDEHRAINLAQGFPDCAVPAELNEAPVAAIRADINPHATTWGARDVHEAIAASHARRGRPSVETVEAAGERLVAFGRRLGLA